jgi:hypothetical protein
MSVNVLLLLKLRTSADFHLALQNTKLQLIVFNLRPVLSVVVGLAWLCGYTDRAA